MAIVRLNKLEWNTYYNSGGKSVSGFYLGEEVYLDTAGIIIKSVLRDCIDQINVTNSFSVGQYFVKKRVCSFINGVFYWQSPEEIQELVRKEYNYCS